MTIRITNKCQNKCLHCMQDSSPDRNEIMPFETFKKSLEFINQTLSININISGGEATLHPEILLFLSEACKSKQKAVILVSNGLFLKDNLMLRDNIFYLMQENKNLYIQITSVKGIYSNYIDKDEIQNDLNELSIYKNIKDRINFFDKLENGVLPIGRAKQNLKQIQKFTFLDINRKVPKCFNAYNIMASLETKEIDIFFVVNYLKTNSKTSLCVPMIKENGDMVFGEYEDCNIVWNVHTANKSIVPEKILGACGSCYTNKTQLDNVNTYLSRFRDKHNKIDTSIYFKENSKIS